MSTPKTRNNKIKETEFSLELKENRNIISSNNHTVVNNNNENQTHYDINKNVNKSRISLNCNYNLNDKDNSNDGETENCDNNNNNSRASNSRRFTQSITSKIKRISKNGLQLRRVKSEEKHYYGYRMRCKEADNNVCFYDHKTNKCITCQCMDPLYCNHVYAANDNMNYYQHDNKCLYCLFTYYELALQSGVGSNSCSY
eukprot:Pgem_evm1s8601